MKDELTELHYIYKMIGNYGFCTVQELLDKYNGQKEVIDKAIERIKKGIFIIPKDTDELLDILKEVSE